MPFETFFQRSRSQGSNKGQNGHIFNLHIYAWISKIILHSCCPRGGQVPFETFFWVG